MAKWWTAKTKWAVAAVAVAGVSFIAYSTGSNSASATIEGERVAAVTLKGKADQWRVDIEAAEAEYDDLIMNLDAAKEEHAEYTETIEAQRELIDILTDYEAHEAELKESIAEMESDLSKRDELTKELAQLSEGITKKEGEPKELAAGTFIVGNDLEPGRYLVTAIGRGSNFKVYDDSGSIKVNTIISNQNDHGVKEYVFYAFDGDIIDSSTPAKYEAVE